MKVKDIPDDLVIELVRECNEARCDYTAEAEERGWGAYHGGRPGYKSPYDPDELRPHRANITDLEDRLKIPRNLLLAKLKKLIKQGKLDGCACGCRGDLSVPEFD